MKYWLNNAINSLKVIFILLFIKTSLLHAQTFKDNIVKLTAIYADNSEFTCFGFIYASKNELLKNDLTKNDFLYIVTVPDISQQGENIDIIKVEYFNSQSITPAIIVKELSNETFLLLITTKPENFRWNEKFCYATYIETGNRVGIIGRFNQWNDFDAQTTGTVLSEGAEFTIDIPTQNPGTNGAPVIFNDCIAGISINDQGNQITAIEYNTLKSNLDPYLKKKDNKVEQAFNLPYIILGLKSDIFIQSLIVGTLKFGETYTWGFYLRTGIYRSFSVRYEKNCSKFLSYDYKVNNATYQFRNHINKNAFRFLLSIGDEYERGELNIFYEIGFKQHNPELRVNENSWSRLDSYSNFNSTYSDKFASYCGGLEINSLITRKILFGFEFSVEKNRNKYLYINPFEPFNEVKRNVWMLNILVHGGIVIGNKEKSNNFLRPDKRNPFTLKNIFK